MVVSDPMKTLYVKDRQAWRRWLEKNHASKKEIWLVYYKKHTMKARIPYDDAVEEAICFGWIDSTVRRLDDERYAQKYTPRSERSKWNQRNVKRARKMIKQGKMTPAGLEKFNNRQEYDRVIESLDIPPDLEKALKRSKLAWKNFQAFAASYRRMYLAWVTDAKRDDTRKRRIARVVQASKENKKPGML
jgi:uncharacterized protein YdeI (YjbR/CyaY-like superfamily)